jgi:hypothetical protein
MTNTPNVNFTVINQASDVSSPLAGVYAVMGKTKRGPINTPSDVIENWTQFVRLFGGTIPDSDFPLLCKRMLSAGIRLRVSRIAHYTTIGDASTLTALKAELINPIEDNDDNEIFSLKPKFEGADYNKLNVVISNADNGNVNAFNLSITLTGDSTVNEKYTNLEITDLDNPNFLIDVINNSRIIDVEYKDISALTLPVRPLNGTYGFENGSDGGTLTATDYIGSSTTSTGLESFNDVSDVDFLSAPGFENSNFYVALDSYVSSRGDMFGLIKIPNNLKTETAINGFKNTTNIDSENVAFFTGGLKVLDSDTNQRKESSEIADINILSFNTHNRFNKWRSFAGIENGVVLNSLGVVNNFGGVGNSDKLNALSRNQVNAVVTENGITYLRSGFTATKKFGPLSYISNSILKIYLIKNLKQRLNKFLERPLDLQLPTDISQEIIPWLESLQAQKAFFSFQWLGDQGLTSLSQLQINDPIDFQNGIYQVEFKFTPVSPLQEISVKLIITRESISLG